MDIFVNHNCIIEQVGGLNIIIIICEVIDMHLFLVNHTNTFHLRFLVHNNNIFCIHLYDLPTCLLVMQITMDASNNYTSLLTKLKAESPKRAFKKPKIKETFYPNKAHNQLLNVCGFIDFLNPPGFPSLMEVNEIVTEFEKEHESLPCPGEISEDTDLLAFLVSINTQFVHMVYFPWLIYNLLHASFYLLFIFVLSLEYIVKNLDYIRVLMKTIHHVRARRYVVLFWNWKIRIICTSYPFAHPLFTWSYMYDHWIGP